MIRSISTQLDKLRTVEQLVQSGIDPQKAVEIVNNPTPVMNLRSEDEVAVTNTQLAPPKSAGEFETQLNQSAGRGAPVSGEEEEDEVSGNSWLKPLLIIAGIIVLFKLLKK